MKSLVNGCAAAALLAGLAFQAHAQVAVREAPVHAVPVDEDDAPPPPPAAPAPIPIVQPAAAPVAEPAPVPAPVKQAEAAPAPAPVEAPPRIEKARLETTAPVESPLMARTESAVVKALTQPRAAPAAPTLTPEENAFFAVLGQRVTDAASAYESYVRRAGAIDAAFSNAASVQRAVKAGAAYQAQQLEEGIVAYAALVALRNPEFVDGVRGMDPRLANTLASSPEQVLRVRGAAEAASDVAGVLRAQGAAVTASGKAITKAAYDIQAQSWSKTPVSDPQTVLANAKTSATLPRAATIPSKEKLLASLVAAPRAQDSAGSGAPDVVRGLALAAMAILGQTGDGKEAQYEALMHDSSSAECLKMAKLNLAQCLAVAGPQYEDVYCSGRHAVSDTGKCVSAAASGGAPVDVAPAPEPARLQQAGGYGPEQAEAYGRVAWGASDLDDEDDDTAQPAPRRYAEVPRAAPEPQQAPARSYAQNDYAQQAQPQYQPAPQYQQPSPYGQQTYQQPQYQQPQYQQQYQQPYPAQRQDYYQQPAYGYAGQQGYYGR